MAYRPPGDLIGRKYSSTLFHQLKEYAWIAILFWGLFFSLFALMIYLSFLSDSPFILIFMIIAILLLFAIIGFKSSTYYLIFRPRILFFERGIKVPRGFIYREPYFKVRYTNLQTLKLITKNYEKDGIFIYRMNRNLDNRVGRKDIDSLDDMDKQKLHRVELMFTDRNRYGFNTVEIHSDFFRSKEEFISFVQDIFRISYLGMKPRDFEPTKEAKRLIDKTNRFTDIKGVVEPKRNMIFRDQFFSRIFNARSIKSIMIGIIAFAVGLALSKVLIGEDLFSLIFIVFISLFMILLVFLPITLMISCFIKGRSPNFNFFYNIGISSSGLFFLHDPAVKKGLDFFLPWEYIDKVFYLRSLGSYLVFTEVSFLRIKKEMAPAYHVRAILFRSKDLRPRLVKALKKRNIAVEDAFI